MKLIKTLSIKVLIFTLGMIALPMIILVDLIDSALWTLHTKVEPKVVWRKIK